MTPPHKARDRVLQLINLGSKNECLSIADSSDLA